MPADEKARLQLSPTQTAAGALAAVTSAVVGSRLGIAGTLVGAAAGSVVASAGSALYGHWLGRTAERVRTVVRVPAPTRPGEIHPPLVADTSVTSSTPSAERALLDDPSASAPADLAYRSDRTKAGRTWRLLVVTAVAMFVVAIGSITIFEAIAGQPVSALTGADAGAGTTIGRAVGEQDPAAEPVPSTEPTPPPTTDAPTEPSPAPTTATTPPTSTTSPPTTTPTPTGTATPTTPPPTTTEPPVDGP